MRRPFYRASARRDLEQIFVYVAREASDRKVGAAFVAKLRARCERLAALGATLGTARDELAAGIRSTPAHDYVIYFRYRNDTLEIINILHGSRDPASQIDPL